MFTMNQGAALQLPPTPIVWLDADARIAYKIEVATTMPLETLNALGEHGWQLCAAVPRADDTIFYFMRVA